MTSSRFSNPAIGWESGPRDYLNEVEGRSPVSHFWIKLDRLECASAVIKDIDDTFKNSSYETQTETERSYANSLLSSYRLLVAVFETISAVALATMFLVAMNTAAMSIRERRHDLAVMRALCFDSGRIMVVLLSECWVIGLLGGLIGLTASLMLFKAAPMAFPNADTGIRLSGTVAALALIISSAIGVLSGLPSTYSVIRTGITEVLRATWPHDR